MPYWHHGSVGLAFAQQFPISALGHPLGARQVHSVNALAPFRFEIGGETEQDLDGFAPIRAVALGVEQTQVQDHVLTVIRRELGALRRFIQESRCRALHQR